MLLRDEADVTQPNVIKYVRLVPPLTLQSGYSTDTCLLLFRTNGCLMEWVPYGMGALWNGCLMEWVPYGMGALWNGRLMEWVPCEWAPYGMGALRMGALWRPFLSNLGEIMYACI